MPVDKEGRWTSPDKAIRSGVGTLPAPIFKGKRNAGWRESDLDAYLNGGGYFYTAKGMSVDIEDNAVEAAGSASEAMRQLKIVLDVFKSTIGNDLTSIKASSTRVQTEVREMKNRYQETADLLNSTAFMAAVKNAERLAVALEAIHRLQGQRIGFALFTGETKV